MKRISFRNNKPQGVAGCYPLLRVLLIANRTINKHDQKVGDIFSQGRKVRNEHRFSSN